MHRGKGVGGTELYTSLNSTSNNEGETYPKVQKFVDIHRGKGLPSLVGCAVLCRQGFKAKTRPHTYMYTYSESGTRGYTRSPGLVRQNCSDYNFVSDKRLCGKVTTEQ